MKRQATINKINEILGVEDYLSIPRGTIVDLDSYNDDIDDINYLIRHGIICEAGSKYVMAY